MFVANSSVRWLVEAYKFIKNSRADSTKSAYKSPWDMWCDWCLGVKHDSYSENIWMFAVVEGNSADTIRQKFFAVQAYWQDADVRKESVFDDRRVNQFLRGSSSTRWLYKRFKDGYYGSIKFSFIVTTHFF